MSTDMSDTQKKPAKASLPKDDNSPVETGGQTASDGTKANETGGPKGPEPTRYGDWESGGRCTDF